jgi:hypothetical protein
MRINYLHIARALTITKPVPYFKSGVWEETVYNVADALRDARGFDRHKFLTVAGVYTDVQEDIRKNLCVGTYCR